MKDIIKPGIKTTEFWLVIANSVAAVTASAAGVLEPKTAAILMAISTTIYTVTRLLSKL